MNFKKYVSLLLVFVIIAFGSITVLADSNVTAEIKIDKIGHIFTDKAVRINANINNGSVFQNVNYTLNVKYNGSKVYETSKTITLNSGETKKITESFDVPQYGFYNVSLSVNGSVLASTRFSVVHAGKTINKKIGFNSHYTVGRGLNDIKKLQNLFADTGFGQMREGIMWQQYEKTAGELVLQNGHKSILESFETNGQNNLMTLSTSNTLLGINFPRTEDEITAWCNYVEELVKAVAPYGVKDFELGNEINMNSSVTAEDYVNLIKLAKPILNKYIEGNRLFVFSLAGEQYTPEWSDYMDACLAIDGCIENFDGISCHPYYNSYEPEEKFAESLAEINTTVEKWGLEDKALIISEAGWTYYNYSSAKEETQAKRAVRLAAMAFDCAEYIDWYVNIEKIDFGENLDQVHFGMLKGWKDQEINYEAKPVFLAMSNFNALLADAQSNGHEVDNDKYIYKFKKNKNNLYMVWKTGSSWLNNTVELNVGKDKVVVYDFYGNSQIVMAENGVVTLRVSDKPVYVSDDIGEGVDVHANTVTIRGMAEETNQPVTVMVLRPEGVMAENTGKIVYVGETKTDDNGLYKFSFKDIAYDKGKYTVRLRVGDTQSSVEYSYSIAVPQITLLNENDEEIEFLSDITGKSINAKLEVINIKNYTVDGLMIAGLYNNDKLVDVQTFTVDVDNTEPTKNYPINYPDDMEIDAVKVLLWDSDCSPMIESITVE